MATQSIDEVYEERENWKTFAYGVVQQIHHDENHNLAHDKRDFLQASCDRVPCLGYRELLQEEKDAAAKRSRAWSEKGPFYP